MVLLRPCQLPPMHVTDNLLSGPGFNGGSLRRREGKSSVHILYDEMAEAMAQATLEALRKPDGVSYVADLVERFKGMKGAPPNCSLLGFCWCLLYPPVTSMQNRTASST